MARGVRVGREARLLDLLGRVATGGERQGVAIRYDAGPRELTTIERDVMEMEAELQAARLLTWRAARLLNTGKPNNLEASMAKAKAGLAVTVITQKAVALLGPVAQLLENVRGPRLVVAHLARIEAINGYAAKLHSLPPLVWGTRIVLLFAVGVHIASAFSLWTRNRAARGSRYKQRKDLATDYAARTMYWSGPILLLFIVYHLLHFTILPAHPGDVYRNVVEGFQVPLIAGVYIVGNLNADVKIANIPG